MIVKTVEKTKQWVLLSVLLLLPSGVFALGYIDPEIRPYCIEFARTAFGSVIGSLATRRRRARLPYIHQDKSNRPVPRDED